jgi:hypothetical protein
MQQQQTDGKMASTTSALAEVQAGSSGSARIKENLAGRSFAEQVQMLAVTGAAGAAGIASPPPPKLGGSLEAELEAATLATLGASMGDKERKTLASWGIGSPAAYERAAATAFKGVGDAIAINNAFSVSQGDVVELVKPYKASWNPTLVGVLQRVRVALADDLRKTQFTFACLRNTNSAPAVTKEWTDAIQFKGLTAAEAAALLEPGSAYLKAVPNLWATFLTSGSAAQLAAVPPKSWPEAHREPLAAMLVADAVAMGGYVAKYGKDLATSITPADMASPSWRGLAASLVRLKSNELPWAVIDALLKADAAFVNELKGSVGVDAAGGQTEFRAWLAGRAPRPFSAEMASIFNAFTDHFDQAEKDAGTAVGAAKTPEERRKAEAARAQAQSHMERSIEQRHGLEIEGQGANVPGSAAKSEAFSAAALRRTDATLRSLPAADVELSPLGQIVREPAKEDQKGISGGHVHTSIKVAWKEDARLEDARLSAYPFTAGPKDAKGKDVFDRDERQFDHMLRHEVGHAVDARYKVMDGQFGVEARGGWKHETGGIEAIAEAAGDKAVFAALTPDEIRALDNDFRGRWKDIAATHKSVADSKTGKWLTRMVENGSHFRILDPVDFGGRVPVFENRWMSFSSAAYKRKVSGYQFKSPGEWFAEAYATYHDTPEKRGANLEKVDKSTKEWLDKQPYAAPSKERG